MRYVIGAFLGVLAGVAAGCLIGFPMILWGPRSSDPFRSLLLIESVIAGAPSGLLVGLIAVDGAARGFLHTLGYTFLAVFGGGIASMAVLAVIFHEADRAPGGLFVPCATAALAAFLALPIQKVFPPREDSRARTGNNPLRAGGQTDRYW